MDAGLISHMNGKPESTPRNENSKPLVIVAYIDDNGKYTELLRNLYLSEDREKIRKTLFWAACSGIEVRIRPVKLT